MVTDHKKIDLFGKSFLQKLVVKPPFQYGFPVSDQACFLYMKEGDLEFSSPGEQIHIQANYSLLLNCINPGREINNRNSPVNGEVVIVTFHKEVLLKIYDKELPLILQQSNSSAKPITAGRINNDFLIQKYIEGLLFYFENPSLVNEEILVLKLKEIVLLLSQTSNADSIRVILSQLFSPHIYDFKQVIESNLFMAVSIEDLARKTNLSLSTFKREFTKLYNDSPANYIRARRLEKAAGLLLASQMQVNEIAFECGFNDLANFTKSFREKFSVTPTEYRSHSHS